MRSASSTPLLSTFIVAVIALSSPLFSPSAHANLVVNGGFEAGAAVVLGAGGTTTGGGDTSWIEGSLSGWQVGPVPATNGPNVLATNQNIYYATASNNDPGVNALSGPHSDLLSDGITHSGVGLAAAFPNTPNFDGYISQAVTGVVGGYIYKIGFWLANQIGDNAQNYMQVMWGGDIINPGDPLTGGYSLNGTGGNPGNPTLPGAIPVPTDWKYYEFITGAPSDNARLTFIGGNTAAGNLIDDVSVVFEAVPEVSSFGMVMGLGLLALGTVARVRRRALTVA